MTSVEVGPDLDLDQELILLRRFGDAIASLVQVDKEDEMRHLASRDDRERSRRIATNTRGRIR